MSCKLLLIGHGSFPQDMLQVAEMICGPTEGVATICLLPDQDLEAYRSSIREQVETNAASGLLILADLKGGTPFLTASRLLKDYWECDIRLITGLNIPMLTTVLSELDGSSVDELAELACETGTDGILDFKKQMETRRKEV